MSDQKKCEPFEHPNFLPSWACCQCNTLNGNQRDECKVPSCNHKRCDSPKVKLVPVEEEGGFRLVPVHSEKKSLN